MNKSRGALLRVFLELAFHKLISQGYELKGYALEFRGTEWETVCMNYESSDKVVRILFNAKFPPIFVFRKQKQGNGAKNPFLVERYKHPFTYLFQKQERLDDRTKQITSFEVRLPTQVSLPQSLKREYRRAISENFKGGLEALATKIKEERIPFGRELAMWLSH